MNREPDDDTLAVMAILDRIETDEQFDVWQYNVRMLWETKKVALAKLRGDTVRTDN